jgi:hypothetical protein
MVLSSGCGGMEEVAEEVEVGFYPQEGLIEMNKNRNVENRVRVKVMKLNAIIEKKASEKIEFGRARPCSTKY